MLPYHFEDEKRQIVMTSQDTKLDEQPFPYVQNEVADIVQYFSDRAEEFGLDTRKFNVIGYSAGAHICAGAACTK